MADANTQMHRRNAGERTQRFEVLGSGRQPWAKVSLVLLQEHGQLQASTGDVLQHQLRIPWVHLGQAPQGHEVV